MSSVPGLSTLVYVSQWIDEQQQVELVQQLHSEKKWIRFPDRKVCIMGGAPQLNAEMVPDVIPQFAVDLLDRCQSVGSGEGGFVVPNHVLLNQYANGQGIAPHNDGPLYSPCTYVLSLCSGAMMLFERGAEEIKVFLEPRSLVVFKDELYTQYKHSIIQQDVDVISDDVANRSLLTLVGVGEKSPRCDRLSFTMRRVPQVKDVNPKIYRMVLSKMDIDELRRREAQFRSSIGANAL